MALIKTVEMVGPKGRIVVAATDQATYEARGYELIPHTEGAAVQTDAEPTAGDRKPAPAPPQSDGAAPQANAGATTEDQPPASADDTTDAEPPAGSGEDPDR